MGGLEGLIKLFGKLSRNIPLGTLENLIKSMTNIMKVVVFMLIYMRLILVALFSLHTINSNSRVTYVQYIQTYRVVTRNS